MVHAQQRDTLLKRPLSFTKEPSFLHYSASFRCRYVQTAFNRPHRVHEEQNPLYVDVSPLIKESPLGSGFLCLLLIG